MKKDALVIGGGISGITVASELAQTGHSALLIEKEAQLGGLASVFCCKASESCNKCFACVVDKRLAELSRYRSLSILTQTELVDLQGGPGAYQGFLKNGKGRMKVEASAIVLATGIEPFDATAKAEYGYGRFKNVITAKDLDEMLRFQGKLERPSDRRVPKTIAFFQCVGSRDESIGNLYCSQVCCAYALRLIKAIRHQYPDTLVTFFYMDIQPAGASFERFLDACRKDPHLRFLRCLPSKVYHSPLTEGLRVRLIDPQKGEVLEEPFDLIVLSVGMVLGKGAKSLAQLFGLKLNEEGFLDPPPFQTGIFVAGACSGPKDIDRSILHSKSIAGKVEQYLKGRN
ncbi:MAG: FAD-dependent oxidoreductase [Desulfobacterota bacterium]|nr:FAD-dependent oxidoreductase [Thermodesulfobacteriota bacterium]